MQMQQQQQQLDYPVVFRCAECTLEHYSLEALEIHIWNRHLRTFPYRCALCGYPALNSKALAAHHTESHGTLNHAMEFKRKISDELRLREIVAQSIVVTMYEEEEELFEEEDEAGMVDQHTIGVQMDGEQGMMNQMDMQSMVYLDGGGGVSVGRGPGGVAIAVADDDDDDKSMPILAQEPLLQQGDHMEMAVVAEEEVVETLEMDGQMGMEGQGEGGGEWMGMEMHMQGGLIEMREDGTPVVAGEEEGEEGGYELFDEHGQPYMEEELEYVDEAGARDYRMMSMGEECEEGYMEGGGEAGGGGGEGAGEGGGKKRQVRIRMMKERHMEMVVGKVASTKMRRPRESTMHECDICGKVSKYPSKIEEHRRSHTGEKPFKCEICGAGFSQGGALKCHMRLHSGERPFACTWDCGRTFVSTSALKMHERMHSGERRHACQVCGQLFSKRSHCLRHMKALHAGVIAERTGLDAAGAASAEVRDVVTSVIDEVHQEKRMKKSFAKPIFEEHSPHPQLE